MVLKTLTWFAAVLLAVALVFVSINRSSKISEKSDFYVYWETGTNFFQGENIYDEGQNNRMFIYPPFAAFLFQGLAIFPLQTSANIFFLLNALILFPVSVLLILRILANYGFERRKITWAVALASVASIKFFWNNLMMFQINFVVFVIMLAGIYYLSRNRNQLSGIFLTVATFIKIYPLFLLIYSFFRQPVKKVFLTLMFVGFLCVFIPSIQRGVGKGLNDHITYYEVFLKEFQHGKLKVSEKVHTLKSFMFKAFIPETRNRDINSSEYPQLNTISNIIILALLGFLLYLGWFQLRKGQLHSAIPFISCVLIFTHLVSGITWTAHLVTMQFSYLPLFLINRHEIQNKAHGIFHLFLIGIALLLAIEGSDTTGKLLYSAIRTWDIFVLFPLVLFVYYSWMVTRKNLFNTPVKHSAL
jgi:hypothetical protein